MKVMGPESYYPLIDREIERRDESKIFIATDQRQFVDLLRNRYGSRVLALEAIRSGSSVNPFQVSDSRNYLKGREVLLDCLILSRCNFLLKCTSAVGEYAMYFNPELDCIDVNHLKQRSTLGDALSVSWNRAKSLTWENDPGTETTSWRQYVRKYVTRNPLTFMLAETVERRRYSSNMAWQAAVLLKDAVGSALFPNTVPLSLVGYRARSAWRRRGARLFDPGNAPFQKYLEIRTDEPGSEGLFTQLSRILEQLHFADAHRLTPVVTLDQPSNRYLDRGRGQNVWDYYFEPVSGLTTSDLDGVDPSTIALLSPDEQRSLLLGVGNLTNEPPNSLDDAGERWFRRRREMAAELIRAHVRVKPDVVNKVDAFYRDHLDGRTVLGVHMCATIPTVDMRPTESTGQQRRGQTAPPEAYWPFIDAFLEAHASARIFLATNDPDCLDQALKRYGSLVVFTDTARASADQERSRSVNGRGYQPGEDVLLDVLLLSRTNYLLRCASSVGEFATFFNPSLDSLDLSYAHTVQRVAF